MKELEKSNLEIIINKQFEINWYDVTFDNVKWEDWKVEWEDWFIYYKTTVEKEQEFRQWLMEYLKPYTIKSKLRKEAEKFILNYGLTTTKNEK